jgi:hypothetical protein
MFGGTGYDHLDLDQNGVCEDYSPRPELSKPYDCEEGPDKGGQLQRDTGDNMSGGNGDDFMFGQEGHDVMRGDAGEDVMFGGTGNDYVDGGDDNDVLFGEGGNDRLFGGRGDDCISGGIGNDRIDGGRGDDYIIGGEGDDDLTGGDGKDVFFSDLKLSYDDDGGFSFTSNDGTDIIRDFDFNEDQDVLGFRVHVDQSAEGELGSTMAQIRTRIFELLDEAAKVTEGNWGVGTAAADTKIEIGGHTLILQDINWQDVVDFAFPATQFTSLGQDANPDGGVGINATANGLDSGGYTAVGSWDAEHDLYCPKCPVEEDYYCATTAT